MIYVWGDGNLDVFTSVDAAQGYMELIDVENGVYEQAFDETGRRHTVETAPIGRSGWPPWRPREARALRLVPVIRAVDDERVDPDAFAEMLSAAISAIAPLEPVPTGLAELMARATALWGVTR